MSRIGRIAAGIGAALTGLGAAALLHPRAAAGRHRTVAMGRRHTAQLSAMVEAGAGRPAARRRRGKAELAERVRRELAAWAGDASQLSVTAHHHTVTLRGEVPELGDIDALEALARRAAGVRDVNNLLRLPATALGAEASVASP